MHYIKHYSLFILLFIQCFASNSETIDGLQLRLKTASNDSLRTRLIYSIGVAYNGINLDSAQLYSEKAYQLSVEQGFKELQFQSQFNLCYIYIYKGEFKKAIEAGNTALLYAKNESKPSILNRLAAAYYYNEDYENAFKTYSQSLQYKGDSESKVLANNGIGNVYYAQNKLQEALKYYQIGYQLSKSTYLTNTTNPDLDLQANCVLNLANTQNNLNNSSRAIDLFNEAITLYNVLNDEVSKALCLMNLGTVYMKQNKTLEAEKCFSESQVIFEKHEDKVNATLCLINLGNLAFKNKLFDEAATYLKKAIIFSKESESLDLLQRCYGSIGEVYSAKGDFENGYKYHKLYSETKDSINTKLYNERIAKQETLHKTKEQEAEIDKLNAEKEKERQRRNFLIALILVGVVVTFFIYKQYRRNKKLNYELAEKNVAISAQNNEIEAQKAIVEMQNQEITDSITYAKHIQHAILPSTEVVNTLLPECFVLYKPKAIVSGDFYFVTEKLNKIIVAVVDCTGHGVPGAFMSIIGHNLLTHLIEEKSITTPAEILNQLHIGVRKLLHQDGENNSSRDGMDICLLSIDKSFKQLEYAGANRPLYHIRNGELNEIKSDKFPVGGLQIENERHFTNHVVDLIEGDTLYLFSDGYADQFGGTSGKKFMVKNLKNTLFKLCDFMITEQKDILENTFSKWKGDNEQIDDVLVMGIKI